MNKKILLVSNLLLLCLLLFISACGGSKYKQGDGEPIFEKKSALEVDNTLQSVKISLENTKQQDNCHTATDFTITDSAINYKYNGQFKSKFLKNLSILGKKNSTNFSSSPIICNDKLYNIDSRGILKAYEIKKDKIIETWSFKINSNASERKSFLSAHARLNNGNVIVTTNNGKILSINARNSDINWEKKYNFGFHSSISIDNDSGYIISDNNTLIAIDLLTGDEKWQNTNYVTDHGIQSYDIAPVVVHNNTIIACTSSGSIVSMSEANGKTLWEHNLSDSSITNNVIDITDIDFTPAIIGKTIIVGGIYSNLFAFNVESGALLWRLESNLSSNIVHNNLDYAFFLNNEGHVIAVNIKTGKIKWINNDLKPFYVKRIPQYLNSGQSVLINPINRYYPKIINNNIHISDTLGKMHAIDIQTGKLLQSSDMTYGVNSSPIVTDDAIYMIDEINSLYKLE